MEILFRICLFITGVINFVPSFLALLPAKISQSYGVAVPDANYELLLRHRAVLFGIIGGLMIYAALKKQYYNLATIMGFVSMLSFVILVYTLEGGINEQLKKVMKIDVIGLVILVIGFVLFKWR